VLERAVIRVSYPTTHAAAKNQLSGSASQQGKILGQPLGAQHATKCLVGRCRDLDVGVGPAAGVWGGVVAGFEVVRTAGTGTIERVSAGILFTGL
jgi:hypothetical protein